MLWSIVGLVTTGMIISYLDRTNLSVALAVPEFKQLFNLTDKDRGLLNSAFFWSYALLQIPAGYLVDRYGVKKPFAIGFLAWSLISAATAFASSVLMLFGLRLLLGAGEAVVTPAGMRWIRYHVPEKQRGLAVGIFFAGAKIGPAIGAPVAVWLIKITGWQGMFLALGLGCLVWLLPWMTLVRDDDRELESQAAKRPGATSVAFGAVMASPAMWGILIGTFCYNYFNYFCMTWLPAYFVERRGLTQEAMGQFTMYAFGSMAVVATLAGFVADRIISRGADPIRVRKAFTLAGFMVASTEIFGALSDSNTVALAMAIISLAGLGLATANYWALTQSLMPGAAIGRIAGAQNMASNLSGIAAPIITGWLKHWTGSYDAPMIAICFFLLLGLSSYLFLVRPKFVPKGVA
jgi:MFS transporter, ACS family, D-galactonate transporter